MRQRIAALADRLARRLQRGAGPPAIAEPAVPEPALTEAADGWAPAPPDGRRFPPEYDAGIYRALHPDLAAMPDGALLQHYLAHGRAEGRRPHALPDRDAFVGLVPPGASVLEIGPFNRPVVAGPGVRYFDVLSQDGLRQRATAFGMPPDGVPRIDHVSATGDLSVIAGEVFDVVVSSHCIEHQPDLVRHLNDVARLLAPGGHYLLMVPDKRFCFDHYLADSTIAGVLDAHRAGLRTHALRSVIEHRVLTTHNDPVAHWEGRHGPAVADQAGRVAAALREYDAAAGGYLDVHAWIFTPESFRRLTALLQALGVTTLAPVRVYAGLRAMNEFWAILEKT